MMVDQLLSLKLLHKVTQSLQWFITEEQTVTSPQSRGPSDEVTRFAHLATAKLLKRLQKYNMEDRNEIDVRFL